MHALRVYCHIYVRRSPCDRNIMSSMGVAMAVHVLHIALAVPFLPHTVRRAQSRAWPGVAPKQEPFLARENARAEVMPRLAGCLGRS